ncbi:hypothetical protein [Rhodococcus sp. YH1]|uniref:hypothetical protein n=1 Tax=Rhodococcus sp. YH1 TaxID=89066 RepID=UPI001386DBF6|nr:hypothetical protein [Rhodococcus sp. YH1]
MSTTDITPELLRAVANWLQDRVTGTLRGQAAAAHYLDVEADNLEREQAHEKRIDELVKVMENARLECDWPGPDTDRSIARALLAHLEQEHNTDDVDQYTARKSYQWDTLAEVPDRITEVYRPAAGSTIFKRRDGEWFEQCVPRPEVRVSAGLIGPFMAVPF